MKMGKGKMIETKRKSSILPWLLIALAIVTILLTAFVFFDVESRRAYSNPGNLSSEVAISGAFIAAPLLIIGIYFVRRDTGFNDRNDGLSLPKKSERISLFGRKSSGSIVSQGHSLSNKSIFKPSFPERNDVRQEMCDEEKLKFACPLCETIVTQDDPICPHCGAEFEEPEVKETKLEEIPESHLPEAEEKEIESTATAEIGLVMHCSQCGNSLVGGKFCKHCGTNVG